MPTGPVYPLLWMAAIIAVSCWPRPSARIFGWAAWGLARKEAQIRVMNRVLQGKFSYYNYVMSTDRNRLATNFTDRTIAGTPFHSNEKII